MVMNNKLIIPFVFLLAIIVISCNNSNQQSDVKASPSNVFASLDYDMVIAYKYNGEGDNEIIDKEGKLIETIEKQVTLNKNQMLRLTNALCDKSTYGGDIAACFDPHFGIVFYKKNKPVAYISICLDCNYLISSIKIPGDGGFSDDGVKEIVDFEKELKFM